MSTLADRTIAALRGNHDELAAKVVGFHEEDLARQSGSSEWDVAQVLSHLGSGAEISLAALQAGLAGKEAPGHDFNQSVWDRWNAMTNQEKAEGFLQANEHLVSSFESLDDTARQELHVTLGFLPFPAGVDVLSGMRLNEATMHGWDVRLAFDPQATLTAQEAEAALDQLTGPLSFMVGSWADRRHWTGPRPRYGSRPPTRAASSAWCSPRPPASATHRRSTAVSSTGPPRRGCVCSPADSTQRTRRRP
jgi:uncharacterized protein (TIGR03083 family)